LQCTWNATYEVINKNAGVSVNLVKAVKPFFAIRIIIQEDAVHSI
jgi:hypothetical protein